jgi:hypothetical protein
LFAQEFNFTQYGVNPLYLNPANTGVMNRDLRAGVTYRDQGRSVSKSYSSAAANIDLALYPKGKEQIFGDLVCWQQGIHKDFLILILSR